MGRNYERRNLLCDAAIQVLAEQGSRGLTYRAVEQAADVPGGTASNYFTSRDELISELVERISARLTPKPSHQVVPEAPTPGQAPFAFTLGELARRLSTDPHVSLALLELRLEAPRNLATATTLTAWRQRSFDADLAHLQKTETNVQRTQLALFYYGLDGLMLDHLTKPIDTGVSFIEAVNRFAAQFLPEGALQ